MITINGEEIYRVKDIAVMLACVALDNGYEPEFLYEMYDECREDGQTPEEAYNTVATISRERDW